MREEQTETRRWGYQRTGIFIADKNTLLGYTLSSSLPKGIHVGIHFHKKQMIQATYMSHRNTFTDYLQ